ncbi:hypothetical protein K491DRAFT_720256 [Lophiostoma macrostomum CBS 122681]|uniref:Uncharacterized protein n=1 Tax=Lophiostoma macrostomum CBS 122681 TaxID=1314788 RepID=A0A6A6STI2_9PLEO|nr:hypothetical protein K491DRAFT_720256 [Lophiostoma macrostomum CBS 122681]
MNWLETNRITRNARIVQKAVEQFDQQFTSQFRFRRRYIPRTTAANRLTPTELSRFVRTYYLVWTLLRTPVDKLLAHLERMTLKQCHLVDEMLLLPQYIGDRSQKMIISCGEGYVPENSWGQPRSESREQLGMVLYAHIKRIEDGRENPYAYWHDDDHNLGYRNFNFIWDHYKPDFKATCVARCPSKLDTDIEYETRGLWEDSEDEEVHFPLGKGI